MAIDTAVYCELKHTLTQPNHTSKENSYFILEPVGSGQFKVSGVSISGKMKQGECKFIDLKDENGIENQEDQLVQVSQHIGGSFFEGEQEIVFEFSFSLVCEEFVLGGGEWTEFKGGVVRQKYKVVLKQPGLSFDSGTIFSFLFDREKKISESLKAVEQNSDKLSEKIAKSSGQLDSMSEIVDANSELVTNISESASAAEKTISAGSDLIDTLEKNLEALNNEREALGNERQKITDLNTSVDETQKRAKEILGRAESVLGESTAAGLSRAFVKRKEQADKLRNLYDFFFGISLIFAAGMAFYLIIDYVQADAASASQIIAQTLVKFPIVAMFIWLGVFFSKKSSSMSRLEEFYAQKQVLAESYVGYKAEIEKLYEETTGHEELVKLMTINLLSIGKDSSEVLDKLSNEKHYPVHELLSDSLKSLFKGANGKE